MSDARKKVLIRLLVCYLIAAGVQTLVLGVGLGAPHSGAGPVIFGALFVFPAIPFMTVAQLNGQTGLDPIQMKSLAYFAGAFAISCLVAFRRELRRWN
jgi:hypothetical protein